MMDAFDLASRLFGNSRAESRGDVSSSLDILTATGAGDSSDGAATVYLDADVTPADDYDDDDYAIGIPTSPNVIEGDGVLVGLTGSGPLKTPVVISNPGSGDRMQAQVDDAETLAQQAEAVATATGQHFWPDDDGVHVTEVTQEGWSDSTSPNYHSGANVLLNALGQLFRDGLTNILAIVSGTDPGVAIYDGEGNDADNILALLTKSLIRLGGKFASSGTSTAKVQFFEDDSALTDLTATHYIDTTTEPQVSHDLALSSTVTDDELPDGTSRTVTGNVEVWEQIYNDGSTYSDQVDVSLNGATTNRQYNASVGVSVIEASGGQVERTAFAVADNLRLTYGTGSQVSVNDVPMEQAIAALTTPFYSRSDSIASIAANTDVKGGSLTVPAGTYIIDMDATIASSSGSGTRDITVGFYVGGSVWSYRNYAEANRSFKRIGLTQIAQFTAQTSIQAYVASSTAVTSSSSIRTRAVRIS